MKQATFCNKLFISVFYCDRCSRTSASFDLMNHFLGLMQWEKIFMPALADIVDVLLCHAIKLLGSLWDSTVTAITPRKHVSETYECSRATWNLLELIIFINQKQTNEKCMSSVRQCSGWKNVLASECIVKLMEIEGRESHWIEKVFQSGDVYSAKLNIIKESRRRMFFIFMLRLKPRVC